MPHYVLDIRTVTNHFPGIGRYTYNLVQAMLAGLESDEQLTLLHNPAQTSHMNLDALLANTASVQVQATPFQVAQQGAIPALLRRVRADLYYSPYYLMPYHTGVATVVTIFDIIPMVYPAYFSATQRLIFAITLRLALWRAGHIHTASQATAHDLTRRLNVSAQRITVIPGAADPTYYPRSAEAIADLRQRLHLPAEYTLYLGSNKPHKNLVRLIEAWATIQPQPGPLVIAGAWDARYPDAKHRAEALGLSDAVMFLGPIAETDLPILYSGATLFVFPSEYEGFGLPVLEAMACGVPVVCAQTSSLTELATDAAVMVNPHDVTALADAMQRLLGQPDLRAKFQQQSLSRTGQLTWAESARATLALFRRLA